MVSTRPSGESERFEKGSGNETINYNPSFYHKIVGRALERADISDFPREFLDITENGGFRGGKRGKVVVEITGDTSPWSCLRRGKKGSSARKSI